MEIINFKDISNEEWDGYVERIPESTYKHTSWWINYTNAIYGEEGCKAFVCFQDREPIAICPVFISKVVFGGHEYMEATSNGLPSVYPAMAPLPATQRRRLSRKVFSFLEEQLKTYGVKRIGFYKHPANAAFINGEDDNGNNTEAASLGYFPYVQNTILVDLQKSEDQLLSETAHHRRKYIKKSLQQGLRIREYNNTDGGELDAAFKAFQAAHFKSAGKLTRPIESWDLMKDLIKKGKASLFIASSETGVDLSYLYCGEFNKFSFGWTQVNLDEFEKEYQPRHLLEWAAMMAYKKRGFKYYELGIKHELPQFNHIPSEKEISIAQFKERYGGKLYSFLFFEKILDKDIFNMIYKKRIEELMSSNYFEGLGEGVSDD